MFTQKPTNDKKSAFDILLNGVKVAHVAKEGKECFAYMDEPSCGYRQGPYTSLKVAKRMAKQLTVEWYFNVMMSTYQEIGWGYDFAMRSGRTDFGFVSLDGEEWTVKRNRNIDGKSEERKFLDKEEALDWLAEDIRQTVKRVYGEFDAIGFMAQHPR